MSGTKPLTYRRLVALSNYTREVMRQGVDSTRDLTPAQLQDVRRLNREFIRERQRQQILVNPA